MLESLHSKDLQMSPNLKTRYALFTTMCVTQSVISMHHEGIANMQDLTF